MTFNILFTFSKDHLWTNEPYLKIFIIKSFQIAENLNYVCMHKSLKIQDLVPIFWKQPD